MKTYPRLLTAMITPFKDDNSVDYTGAQKLALSLLEEGNEGLVVTGTTGESPTLSKQEKLSLYTAVKEAVGDKGWVIAGTGSNSTAASIALTKEASRLGLDGIMAVTPYYNKPNQEGLFKHFQAIAEATSLPVILYNVPGRTGVNMLPETIARLGRIQNIIAVKEASANLDQVSAIRSLLPEDFLVYSGDDSLTLPILSLGGHGVISVASHVAGRMIREMIDAFLAGRVDEARKIHLRLFPLFKAMFITTNPIPVKKAVSLLGLPAGKPRLPLVETTPAEENTVKKAMEDLQLL